MSGQLDDVRDSFIQLWGRLGGFWGVPPTTARVHGYLLTQIDPVDAETIVTDLGMSRGAVSMACRELRDWGLVYTEREPGSRRDRFRAETDLEKAIRTIVQTRKRREWDPLLSHLQDWIPALDGLKSSDAQAFRDRLKDIEAIVGLADSMAEDFLKGGVLQRLGLKAMVNRARKRAARK